MQTLILSCNTGAGHNSCAQAVQEAYHSRGEICNITDSLQFISEKASTFWKCQEMCSRETPKI